VAGDAPVSPWQMDLESRWNAVETWRGTALVEDHDGTGGKTTQRRTAFVLDRRARCIRWSRQAEGSGLPDTKMFKHGAVYQFADQHAAMTDLRGGSRGIVISVPHQGADWDSATDIDPIEWLTAGLIRVPAAFVRPGGALVLDDLESFNEVGGAATRFAIQGADERATVTIDPAQGGSIVAVQRTSTKLDEGWTIRWQAHGGVWAPAEITIRRTHSNGRTLQRRIQLLESIVNLPVARHDWSLAQFGAQSGDLVRDEIRDVQFAYHSSEGGQVQRSSISDEQDSSAVSIILNVAVWIVILGCLSKFSRRRRTAT